MVSKSWIAPPHTVRVASIHGTHMDVIKVDEVPITLVGKADTLYPSVHHTKRSVTTVR